MTFVIPFPAFDPVLVEFGPFVVRWYALAYIAGFLVAWRYVRVVIGEAPVGAEAVDADDYLTWAILGTIIGGRLGYVVFYNPAHYAADPMAILMVWRGGMSFHGGLIGLAVSALLFARRRSILTLPFIDLLVSVGPLGIFLGRLANFINGELFGRPTDVPWAMVFPRGGPVPRHPSQLYEALLEGLVLLVLLFFLRRVDAVRLRPGMLTGIFLMGYAVARGTVELFRQPDAHIGLLSGGTTMGQWLSAPMLAIGLYLILAARVRDD